MWITLCCVNTTAINNKKGIIVIFIAVTHSLGLKTRNHSRADHCHSLVLETQAIIMLVTVIIWCCRHRIIMLVIVTVWCWRHRQSSCWSLSQSGVGDTENHTHHSGSSLLRGHHMESWFYLLLALASCEAVLRSWWVVGQWFDGGANCRSRWFDAAITTPSSELVL